MAPAQLPINTHRARPRATPWFAVVALMVVCFACGTASAQQDLQTYQSKHYLIHNNLKLKEVRALGEHMDTVFDQFQDRFREFQTRGIPQMPLYLLRNESDYQRFMRSQDINAANTGGMFFYSPKSQGLATWAQGRSRSQTFQVLQHEGFHQFAFNYLGQELPVWMNEGLAQYFEDAIIVGDNMITGHANARRLAQVKHALENDSHIDFAELIGLSTEDWNKTLRGKAGEAALMYAQAWSVTFFLIHGEDERYQRHFVRYLQKVSKGQDSRSAFKEAFGARDLTPLAKRWESFALKQQPDPLNIAASRMEFLGEALRFMDQRGEKFPRTLGRLRASLRKRNFVLTRRSHGVTIKMAATDPNLYRFRRSNGSTGLFRLLEPVRNDLPPRITAPGLRPEPTLVWSRDVDGKLVQDIEYR